MGKPLSNQPKVTVNRNSRDGKFVTESYAKRHPGTTETERVRRPNK